MSKTIITTNKAPEPIGPYNQAIKFGDLLFVSGQIALNPENMRLVMSSIQEETHQVMKNLQAVLKESGYDFSNVIKTSIFLSDMIYFKEVNEVYGTFFTSDFPARETVAVQTLPKNVNVEISLIAGK